MIGLTHSEIGLCLSFSYEITARTEKYYKLRNKYSSTEKLIMDHALAKMSEIATYKYLTSKGYKTSYPSFSLEYDESENYDLYIIKDGREINVHCKVVRHDSPVKESWLIQKNDVKKLKESDYFSLCKFHNPGKIEVMKIVHHSKISWKEPVIGSLRSKYACYFSDII